MDVTPVSFGIKLPCVSVVPPGDLRISPLSANVGKVVGRQELGS
jgi:hypothetical protein